MLEYILPYLQDLHIPSHIGKHNCHHHASQLLHQDRSKAPQCLSLQEVHQTNQRYQLLNYGNTYFTVTREEIEALLAGKILAGDVGYEYGVFVEMEDDND